MSGCDNNVKVDDKREDGRLIHYYNTEYTGSKLV